MSTLKADLIRLAHRHPEFRKDLLPLVRKATGIPAAYMRLIHARIEANTVTLMLTHKGKADDPRQVAALRAMMKKIQQMLSRALKTKGIRTSDQPTEWDPMARTAITGLRLAPSADVWDVEEALQEIGVGSINDRRAP